MATFFSIDSAATIADSAAARFARLRNVPLVRCEDLDSLRGQIPKGLMIAISASRSWEISASLRGRLAHLVGEGATLYVRGVARRRATLDLAPFAPFELAIAGERRAVGYRFTGSRMLPAVLAHEEAMGSVFETPGVERLNPPAEALLMVRHVDGIERAAIFALRYGRGCVIYDQHPEDEAGADAPIVARMASPEVRNRDVGALVAADRAAGIDPARLPPFNLMIDDRPANFDHFNAGSLSAFLRHINDLSPGAHTDFAWTPCHANPCRGYLEATKKFSTGFVWHGLWRHVDHRAISDPAAELAEGKRMVSRIERRFGIRLQPIMIFPFERSAPEQFSLLMEAGFQASVEEPHYPSSLDAGLPGYLAYSLPSRVEAGCGFTILYRYPAASLARDRMLAMAALGLPILACAHPGDVGLRRLSRLWDRGGDVHHFDEVLNFASSKGLPSRSLEDIAAEVGERRVADNR